MAINMRTIEEWIAESNARHEEDFGHVVEEMKEVCVGLDNATLIYTKNVFCFGKSRSIFLLPRPCRDWTRKDEYVEIEKLKYDAITNSNLKQMTKILR